MAIDDLGDREKEFRELRKIVERMMLSDTSHDGSHAGTGSNSVALGPDDASASGTNAVALGRSADATGYDSVAVGRTSKAYGSDYATAVGAFSWADEEGSSAFGGAASAQAVESTALGYNTHIAFGHTHSTAVGADAETTGPNQVRLGVGGLTPDTVSVPGNLTVAGTFSNPSARHLKQNIIPAPPMQSIFPDQYEWEYIDGDGGRRTGPIADELLGTDAERFLTFDEDGRVAGIESVALLTAQVAALHARVTALENTPFRKLARWFWTLVRRQHG
jgi:hypothetical protein